MRSSNTDSNNFNMKKQLKHKHKYSGMITDKGFEMVCECGKTRT